MPWTAKATFSVSSLATAHRLGEYLRHYCGIESKTLIKTLKTKMSHLTLLLQQTQVGMPNASSLFHDTLLNKINGLIKFHERFIDNKIGNKKSIQRN